MEISRTKSVDLIKRAKGKFINVKFVKKDGTERSLTGRTGVHSSKHAPLTGTGMSYDPNDYGLMTMFDSHKKAYRMVNLNTVLEVTVDGVNYKVVPDNAPSSKNHNPSSNELMEKIVDLMRLQNNILK